LVSPICRIGGPAPAIVFTEAFKFLSPTSTCGNDQFYLPALNSPLQIPQGGFGHAFLIMAGPWVGPDLGENATGKIVSTTLPGPPSSRASVEPGHRDNQGGAYGLMEFNVTVPLKTGIGPYTVTVEAQDAVTNAIARTVVPIQVVACTPSTPTTTCTRGLFGVCGPISDGCGGTVNCGVCDANLLCSSSHCCPSGSFWNTSSNVCQPTSCPAGTSYCVEILDCATTKECQRAAGGGCKGRTCQ
jgi:hypothetical protein